AAPPAGGDVPARRGRPGRRRLVGAPEDRRSWAAGPDSRSPAPLTPYPVQVERRTRAPTCRGLPGRLGQRPVRKGVTRLQRITGGLQAEHRALGGPAAGQRLGVPRGVETLA